jgi:tripartite-type tricarboxylate transporter receptor subunit TctC
MSHVSRRTFAAGLAFSALAPAIQARAQTASAYPVRPIKVVVPFPPGGASDFTARVVAAKMSEGLGQPMIIDTRPGAGTSIANDAVAKSAPDGYTLLQVNRDLCIAPSTYASLPYDTLKAFAWIGKAADGPFVLVANPSLPAQSLAELAALAKAKPGTVSYGNLTIGGLAHMNVEALMRHLDINLQQIPYKGAGPALNAAVSGEVAVTLVATTGALPFVREGRLRALAVGTETRHPLYPDTPTFSEAGGGADTVRPTFFGLAAPEGTPRPIVDKLSAELKRVMTLPDVLDKLVQNGLVPAYITGEALGATVASDIEHFGKLVKAIGIAPQ